MAEYFDRMDALLGDASRALSDLVGRIRMEYVMDEFYDGKDEVKFRRGGKTLVTLYLHEGYFTLLLIYGKAEREVFEARRAEFPVDFCALYDAARTYHDGKWMFYDVHAGADVDMLMRLLHIKKRPNRKPEKLDGAVISLCGNRCDQCMLHKDHLTRRHSPKGRSTAISQRTSLRRITVRTPVRAVCRKEAAITASAQLKRGFPAAANAITSTAHRSTSPNRAGAIWGSLPRRSAGLFCPIAVRNASPGCGKRKRNDGRKCRCPLKSSTPTSRTAPPAVSLASATRLRTA